MAVGEQVVEELYNLLGLLGVEVQEVVEEVSCYKECIDTGIGLCEYDSFEGLYDVLGGGVLVSEVYVGGDYVSHRFLVGMCWFIPSAHVVEKVLSGRSRKEFFRPCLLGSLFKKERLCRIFS